MVMRRIKGDLPDVQENGGKFLDGAGKMNFDAPGEIGMLDWGAYTPAAGAGKGVGGLAGNMPRGYSMA